MAARELAPFHDRDVGLEKPLLDPAAVVAVEFLGRLARPDVIVIEAVEGEVHPFVLHLLAKSGGLGLAARHAPQGLQVAMSGRVHGHVPFELVHARFGPGIDLEHAGQPDRDIVGDLLLAEMALDDRLVADGTLEDRNGFLAEQVVEALWAGLADLGARAAAGLDGSEAERQGEVVAREQAGALMDEDVAGVEAVLRPRGANCS